LFQLLTSWSGDLEKRRNHEMGETTIGENGEYVPGHYNYETAVTLARAAATISNTVVVLYFVAIQFLLIRVQSSKSKIGPTTTETQVAVTALWTVHRIVDYFFSNFITVSIRTFWSKKFALEYQNVRNEAALDLGHWWIPDPSSWTWRSSFALIFCEIMATWLMFTSTSLGISLVKRVKETRQSPHMVFTPFKHRCFELAYFMGNLFQEAMDPAVQSAATNVQRLDKRKMREDDSYHGQRIELRRHQDENPVDGQRTLNWDMKVDRETLREMMETLGPPGMFFCYHVKQIFIPLF
jgi:hypothetical protein